MVLLILPRTTASPSLGSTAHRLLVDSAAYCGEVSAYEYSHIAYIFDTYAYRVRTNNTKQNTANVKN